MSRCRKCVVSAKSRTSFDLATSNRSGITLSAVHQHQHTQTHISFSPYPVLVDKTYLIKPTPTQTPPSNQPTVLSPLTLAQSRIRPNSNFCPATSAVKRINTVAVT